MICQTCERYGQTSKMRLIRKYVADDSPTWHYDEEGNLIRQKWIYEFMCSNKHRTSETRLLWPEPLGDKP